MNVESCAVNDNMIVSSIKQAINAAQRQGLEIETSKKCQYIYLSTVYFVVM